MKATLLLMLIILAMPTISSERLVVVINADSPINSISKEELVGIYMGRYRSGNGNDTFSPVDNESLITIFYSQMTNKTVPQVNSYWARLKFTGREYKRPIQVSTSQDVLAAVIRDKNAIGYIPSDQVDASVKVIYEIN